MFLGSFAGCERAQIPTFACFGIRFSGIEPVLAGFEFSDHI
jgi:hypothetical protein